MKTAGSAAKGSTPSGKLTASATVKTGEGYLVWAHCVDGTIELRDGTGDTDTPILIRLAAGDSFFPARPVAFGAGLRAVVASATEGSYVGYQ